MQFQGVSSAFGSVRFEQRTQYTLRVWIYEYGDQVTGNYWSLIRISKKQGAENIWKGKLAWMEYLT